MQQLIKLFADWMRFYSSYHFASVDIDYVPLTGLDFFISTSGRKAASSSIMDMKQIIRRDSRRAKLAILVVGVNQLVLTGLIIYACVYLSDEFKSLNQEIKNVTSYATLVS